MTTKRETTEGPEEKRFFMAIKQGLGLEEQDPQFSDVVVVVEEREFMCHRLLLAATSEFFKGLFSSGMRESLDKRVNLHGISSEVFGMMRGWMYFGGSFLTTDNVFDIIDASDQLRVDALLLACRDFLKENLSTGNGVRAYNTAKARGWGDLAAMTWTFLVNNFVSLTFSELDQLSFEDIRLLVSNSQLKTNSEDLVVFSILSWVHSCADPDSRRSAASDAARTEPECNGGDASVGVGTKKGSECMTAVGTDNSIGPEEPTAKQSRVNYLAQLLASTRYLLVSQNFLWDTLYTDPLLQSDPRCHELLVEIAHFKARPDTHQYSVPWAAMHRTVDTERDVLVTVHAGEIMFQPLAEASIGDTWFKLAIEGPGGDRSMKSVAIVDNELFCEFLVPRSNRNGPLPPQFETRRHKMPIQKSSYGTSCNDYYSASSSECNVVVYLSFGNFLFKMWRDGVKKYTLSRYRADRNWENVANFSDREQDLACSTRVGSGLVLFWREPDTTNLSVERFDVDQKTSLTLTDQIPSCAGGVTFWKDDKVYFLQNEGLVWHLRPLARSPFLSLERQTQQLWNGRHTLTGAMLVADHLIVFTGSSYESIAFCEPSPDQGVFSFINRVTWKKSQTRPIHAVASRDIISSTTDNQG